MSNKRRTSYVLEQISVVNDKLQLLFDDIGLTPDIREERERGLYSALSAALENHLQSVSEERDRLKAKCEVIRNNTRNMINIIRDIDPGYILGDELLSIVISDVVPPLNITGQKLEHAHSLIEMIYDDRAKKMEDLLQILRGYTVKLEVETPTGMIPNADDPSSLNLSMAHMTVIENEIKRQEEEYKRRLDIISTLSNSIITFWTELGTPQSEVESSVLTNYKSPSEDQDVSMTNITHLETISKKLMTEKARRVETLDYLKKKVHHLWDKLTEDSEYCEIFKSTNCGITENDICAYETEFARLNEKKKKYICVFILDARKCLDKLWEQLYSSDDEKLAFLPAWSDVYTEASLEAHEKEISRLNDLYKQRKPIIACIEAYKEIVCEAQKLEQSTNDSSRLLSKGPRRDPSRLLREEQMRKSINKRKPKVINELKQCLTEWQENHDGTPFLVKGVDYMEIVLQEEEKLSKSSVRGRLRSANSASNLNNATTNPNNAPQSSRVRTGSTSPMRNDRSISPVRRDQRTTPARPNQRTTSPITKEQRFASSVRRDTRTASPVRRDPRTASPVRREQRITSPVRRVTRSISPLRKDQRLNSPSRRDPRSSPPTRKDIPTISSSPIRKAPRIKNCQLSAIDGASESRTLFRTRDQIEEKTSQVPITTTPLKIAISSELQQSKCLTAPAHSRYISHTDMLTEYSGNKSGFENMFTDISSTPVRGKNYGRLANQNFTQNQTFKNNDLKQNPFDKENYTASTFLLPPDRPDFMALKDSDSNRVVINPDIISHSGVRTVSNNSQFSTTSTKSVDSMLSKVSSISSNDDWATFEPSSESEDGENDEIYQNYRKQLEKANLNQEWNENTIPSSPIKNRKITAFDWDRETF
ncbi:hypothetical protein NADFUDRAFT_49703 [Nadsonia fulvescens var. elongata DSM 6958]|uniref:Microtubule associated protein n=1 Tax=Nadsonia fulvescens var. elongata DSM 6958 TaxID=857566 RepID=A0A1E3PPB5_9ASCO|nr:hypothetical protein NADFUDRAFT_49703 [Nadsonia fulvescens var. elongata DSM 6958]